MKRKEIIEKVTTIIVNILMIDESEIIETANLQDDLGMDSIDAVELIMDIEKEFNIFIPDDEAESIKTVGEIYDYIEKKV